MRPLHALALAAALLLALSLGASPSDCSGPTPTVPVVTADDDHTLDDGSCRSSADCPDDYPHCCRVGGYATCFEEECEDVGGVELTISTTGDDTTLDNGACRSSADCPADYPHCCRVGGYATCFEEKCDEVGGVELTTGTALIVDPTLTDTDVPVPLDDGRCRSDGDCPSDYPYCCRGGSNCTCFGGGTCDSQGLDPC